MLKVIGMKGRRQGAENEKSLHLKLNQPIHEKYNPTLSIEIIIIVATLGAAGMFLLFYSQVGFVAGMAMALLTLFCFGFFSVDSCLGGSQEDKERGKRYED